LFWIRLESPDKPGVSKPTQSHHAISANPEQGKPADELTESGCKKAIAS
jgi:hypothetical protein